MVVACVECRCRVRAVMPRLINVEACARATDAGAAAATARELTAGASGSTSEPARPSRTHCRVGRRWLPCTCDLRTYVRTVGRVQVARAHIRVPQPPHVSSLQVQVGRRQSQPDPVVRTAAYRSLVLTFECRSHRT